MLVLDSVNEIFAHHLELLRNLIVVLCNQKPIHFVGFLLNLNIISEFFQLLWYSYFRIIKLSSFIYTNQTFFLQFHSTTRGVIIILHFMGIIWSYKLVKKNIKNFNVFRGMYGYSGGGCSALLDFKCKINNND